MPYRAPFRATSAKKQEGSRGVRRSLPPVTVRGERDHGRMSGNNHDRRSGRSTNPETHHPERVQVNNSAGNASPQVDERETKVTKRPDFEFRTASACTYQGNRCV